MARRVQFMLLGHPRPWLRTWADRYLMPATDAPIEKARFVCIVSAVLSVVPDERNRIAFS